MAYSTKDTDWNLTAKGNYWRRLNEKLLVVGKNRHDNYWVRVYESFLPDSYLNLKTDKAAAEQKVKGAKNDLIDCL